eukprot:NODE_31_length_37178_cov_0.413576.p20 type:complete len:210 gc:universal NODE_31_length_37178_cov_0.413576:29544-30173(+)
MFFVLVFAIDSQVKIGYQNGKCQLTNNKASVLTIFPMTKMTCDQVGTPENVKSCDSSLLVQTCYKNIEEVKVRDEHLHAVSIGMASDCEYKLSQPNGYKLKLRGAKTYFSLNEQFKINDMDKNNPFHHVLTTCQEGSLIQYFCDDTNLDTATCFPSTRIMTPENLFCYSSEPCTSKQLEPKNIVNVAGDQFVLFDHVMIKERRKAKDEL